MESLNVYASKLVTKREYFAPGHRACQGCAEALAVRFVAKALGTNCVVASATGCMEIVSSPFPFTNWRVPWIHVAFENAAAVISGAEAATKALVRKGRIPDRRTVFLGMGGDGGTSDIGLQALSGAFERGHNFIYVCYDNEAYMNTGVQRSSATPLGASTTTSPAGSKVPGQITWKKNMAEIAVAHGIPYVATACSSYPFDLMRKVEKAASIPGPKYIHILSVCPTGWGIGSERAIWIGRQAVETRMFPLYEVEKGKYRITYDVPEARPIDVYLKAQTRFRHVTPELTKQIQDRVNAEWEKLVAKTNL